MRKPDKRKPEIALALLLILFYGVGDIATTFYIQAAAGFGDEVNPFARAGGLAAVIALKGIALLVILAGQAYIRKHSPRIANSLLIMVILFGGWITLNNLGYINGSL